MLDRVANLRLRNSRRDTEEFQSDCEFDPERMLDAEESNTNDIDWKATYPFVVSFIQTAAASDAALLLAAQTVEHTEMKSYAVHIILLVAGLFYFFLSQLADCWQARVIGLPLYLGQNRAGEVVIPQVANLLLIILLRAGVWWSAGMEASAGA
jgi:hypothetical protein